MKHSGLFDKHFCKKESKHLHRGRKKTANFHFSHHKSMGTISCHSNQSSYPTGIKNITFRSPIPIAAIYVEYGKNLPHASEEMSFENVD